MFPRSSVVFVGALLVGCAEEAPKSDGTIDVLDLGPGNVDVETSDEEGSSSGVPVSWEGPSVEPVEDAVWGGFAIFIEEMDCTVWWEVQGEQVPCDGCTFGFELMGDYLDDSCGGLGVGEIDFQLEIIDGYAYGLGSPWGEATWGGGVLTWSGYYAPHYSYRYYGYVHY